MQKTLKNQVSNQLQHGTSAFAHAIAVGVAMMIVMVMMRGLLAVMLVMLAVLLSGCSTLRGGRLLAPETFGFERVTDKVYIEAGADAATRTLLQDEIRRAEQAMQVTYGAALSQPVFHACLSEQCLYHFGGEGTFAKAYGNRILLSRRGLNWHFIAHEWSHAELVKRLDLLAWREMPQWFDEGLAVAVSEAPEHAEQHWQYLDAHGIAKPNRDELLTLKKLAQWLAAGERYQDGKNAERRSRGEQEIHALYAAAGHEVRPWFAQVGTAGLLALIAQLNAGIDFADTYPQINAKR
ncbi:MAG: hypothetical protein K2P84_07855 [Undibacterium sp.]|nr:hypothetical protein [Undibacterium sp.]